MKEAGQHTDMVGVGDDVPTAGADLFRTAWERLFPWLAAALIVQGTAVIVRDAALATALPIGAAQGALLQEVYDLAARWSSLGWLGFWQGLASGAPRPTFAAVLGSLVEVYGGGGRLALLLPGLALLLASELVFAAAALRLTRSPGLAALGVGFLMLRTRPWLAGTGLFTFNTAWPVFCCFGLAVSLMMAPPVQRRLVRALACVVLALLALCSSGTAFACLLVVAALRLAIQPGFVAPKAAAAVAAVALAGGAAALLRLADACPVVPATGILLDEGMAARCGYGLRTSLLYLASFEFGLNAVLAAVVALGAPLVLLLLRGKNESEWRSNHLPRGEVVFLAVVVVVLAGLQVLRRAADPIGSGLADMPLTGLLLAAIAAIARRCVVARRPARLTCFGFMALCAVLSWSRPILDPPAPDGDRNHRAASDAASWLVRDAEATERLRAHILVTAALPSIEGPNLSAFLFETFGERADFTVSDEVLDDLRAFDYAVLPADALAGPTGIALQHRLNAGMIRRAELDPQGLDLVVYAAPEIKLGGVSGDWLLAQGTSLRFAVGEVPPGSVIAMRGQDGYARYVPEPPTVTAAVAMQDGNTVPLAARFVRAGDSYAIIIDPAPILASAQRRADVALTFSRFFVPKDVGLNADPRRLAVMAPTSVGFEPRASAFDAARTSP